MRLIIDCFKQVKGVGKSIGIYNVALNLTQNLVEEQKRTDNAEIASAEIIVLGNPHNACDFNMDGVKFIAIDAYDPLNKLHCVIWELFAVSQMCKKLKADCILFPRGYCAITHPVKDIVLIHDLIPFHYNQKFPGVFGKTENAYIMHRLKTSARSADSIITISEASKQDIIQYCGVNEKKITVIHNACNAISFSEEKQIPEKPYICAVTSGLPHKNAKGVLQSYQRYCEISKKPIDLVVIGISDTAVCNLPESVRLRITCYKYIKNNDDMYRIIKNSEVFLFLSLLEGFGLPPIEAMQLKVPVICSNVSSLPEVVGNAALLVNPTSPDDVAIEIERLLADKELKKELITKGETNIERFSWKTRAKLYWNAII